MDASQGDETIWAEDGHDGHGDARYTPFRVMPLQNVPGQNDPGEMRAETGLRDEILRMAECHSRGLSYQRQGGHEPIPHDHPTPVAMLRRQRLEDEDQLDG